MKKIFFLFSLVLICACSPKVFKHKWTNEVAPEKFKTRFETTKGPFEIEITRISSPLAVDRFYQLVKHQYFNNALFYRVNPGFVAQFGSSDSISQKQWNAVRVPDEEVIQGNNKGALSFARSGKETRTTDLFINLEDNNRLDTINYNGVKGFPAFGKVTKGMSVVESLYSGYADTTMSDFNLMYKNRTEFLKKFPKLEVIQKVYLID